jgi:hypothetical protein
MSGISVKKKSKVCSPSVTIGAEYVNMPLESVFVRELVRPVMGFLARITIFGIPVPDSSSTLPLKSAVNGTARSFKGTWASTMSATA